METFTVLLVALSCLIGQTFTAQTLTSPILTNWGTWGEFQYCPAGSKVIRMQLKVEPWDAWDGLTDDSCVNAIKLVCGNPINGDITAMITSKEGPFGRYKTMHQCNGDGYAIGFMLRVVEEDTAVVDETATNNVRILCAGSTTGFMELDGENWGEWTNPRMCDSHEYICGIQTQVEDNQGATRDDTALNNIRVQCCDLSKEDMIYYGLRVRNTTISKSHK